MNYRESPLRRAYYRSCDWFSGFSQDRMLRNLTLVNSAWGREVFHATYPGAETEIVYPPVALPEGHEIPWEERPLHEFLCLGDWLPEKKVEQAMKLVLRLRGAGVPAVLHVVGDGEGPYADGLRRLARANAGIILHGRQNRAQVANWVRALRYGLHMRDFEGFGIAVAEMAAGGMIPFVHEGGGQSEVVAGHPMLCFRDPDDAFAKISQVISDAQAQKDIRRRLASHCAQFNVDRFQETVRRHVRDFCADAEAPAPFR